MSKCIKMRQFMQALFGDETTADKTAEIGQAIPAACSLRLTDIAAKMKGNSDSGYKRIGWFKPIHVKPCGACFKSKRSL